MDHLTELENQSIYILREAYKNFKHLAMLWSIGKDSTVMLWLARKAFFGHCPIPLVHIDTSYKIPEMIEYRDQVAKEWKLNLIVGQNKKALAEGMNHEILFKWLFADGINNLGKLWWLYALIILTFVLAINTVICNINRFSSLIKYKQKVHKRKWIELSSYLMHLGFLTLIPENHQFCSSPGSEVLNSAEIQDQALGRRPPLGRSPPPLLPALPGGDRTGRATGGRTSCSSSTISWNRGTATRCGCF